jgi:hypothetical protein
LLTPKYHKYTIYTHNIGEFELNIITTVISMLDKTNKVKIEPVIKDGQFISIKIKYGYRKDYNKYRYYLLLLNSTNILPLSLKELI